ncbi:MAG: DUF489 family protein [Mariprofundaceae bacterium]|nr:DUF489 family protein [Mariprofundaceae bacterium]
MGISSIDTPLYARVMALAGLAHVAFMVNEIARFGRCHEDDFSQMINTLFANTVPKNTLAKKESGQQQGSMLVVLKKQLRGEYQDHTKNMMHYMMGLTALEKVLAKQPDLLETIGEKLQKIDKNQSFFGDGLHENTIAAIAGLYGDTLSTLKPRIIIHGKTAYLNHVSNTNRVRALLLVGIRMAYLWRHDGGNHFRLVFERNKMLRMIETIQQEGKGE